MLRLEAHQLDLQQDPLLLTHLQRQFTSQLLAWKDALLATGPSASTKRAWQRFEEEESRVVALADTLVKSTQLDRGTRDALSSFQAMHRELGKECRQVIRSRSGRLYKLSELADEEVEQRATSASDLLDQARIRIIEAQRRSLEGFRADLVAEEWWSLGVMLVIGIMLGGLGIYLHDRWITQPILEAQRMAKEIATGRWKSGDLDITGNDNLSELLRCLDDLHATLEKRTDELVEARDRARDANRAKTEFLSRMSHEMRTPLVGVLGTTELLLNTDLQPDQKDFVETLGLSSRHLVSMIEDVLDFAQVDSGEFEIAQDEFDVRALFEDVVEPMAEQAHGKALELGCMIEKKVPTRLIGDARRIRHVATKLISNALKFTHRGGIMISISMLEDGESSCQIRVDIRDTGSGMSAEASKGIFETFSQKDVSLTRKYGGLGIGLSLAKRIVDRMGGHLGFETVEGEGSTFWFRLRLVKVERKVLEEGSDPQTQIEGRRVLCMVDNEVGMTIFGRLMSMLKLEVDWAQNALQARAHLVKAAQESKAYAVILLDSHDAQQDLDVVTELRADKDLGEQHFILLTKPLGTEDRQRAHDLDIGRILVKPCRESTLRETLEEEVLASKLGRVNKEEKPFQADILLVDDNTVNQRVGKRLLEKLGCTVDIAADGREGLKMSGQKDYAIIFMDCHMPEMDGYQSTMAIRERERNHQSEGVRRNCIIAMTADGVMGVRESCLASGMDDYAVKPIRKDQLHELLQKWLGDEADRRETGRVQVGAGIA